MTTVLVTGASGFVGAHVVRELRAAGCLVRALSRRPEADASIATLGAEPVRGDLDDEAALRRAVDGCDAVFHLAGDTRLWAPYAARIAETNLGGTERLLRAAEAAGVGAFVHTSSTSAWSHRVEGVIDEAVPQAGATSWVAYERSKWAGEQAVRRSVLPWVVLNPSHILGPGDRRNWARLIMMIDRGTLPGVPPGAGSFADVREVARAHVQAWQRGRFGQGYLLGGEHASFVDFARRVGERLGRRTPSRPLPRWLLTGLAHASDAWGRLRRREPDVTPEGAALTSHRLQVDSGRAVRELGYRITPLDALLDDTIAWMRAEGMVGR
jgi:nucleoside-diphosphate-sugar epimerase